MSRYRRVWVPGGMYFFTVNLLEQRRTLLVDRVADLRAAFRAAHAVPPFAIIAMVRPPALSVAVARRRCGQRHTLAAYQIIVLAIDSPGRTPFFASSGERRRGIWQRRYWEHLVTDEHDLQRHVDYIHFNPIKHGYVAQASDWPWSSIHRWIRAGDVPVDWGGSVAGTVIEAAGESCGWE